MSLFPNKVEYPFKKSKHLIQTWLVPEHSTSQVYQVSYRASLRSQKSNMELIMWCKQQNVFVYKSCVLRL